ncbi:hypothetical protein [Mycoplasma suis]|uniref:Uncharacterized protein n=2 Tax=Mycoplasma suis TaxID=57372 RepID=F0QQC2_MYCSL|nr:hypothetical protein [Mycoplasma suis]ADX97692.1 hypothetical protein MSU_0148 [Mycoplasma suis str. Illinois]CBZ40232.1 hypothetical protein MSUIS_01390 [Mycoplasma suis KI3806]
MIGLVSPLKALATTISLSGVVAGGYGVSYLLKDEGAKLIPEEKRKVGPTETRRTIKEEEFRGGKGSKDYSPSVALPIIQQKKFAAEEIYKQDDGKTICKNLILSGNSVSFEIVEQDFCDQKVKELWNSDSQRQPKLWIRADEKGVIEKDLKQHSITLTDSSAMNKGWKCQDIRQDNGEKWIVSCEKEVREQSDEEEIL